MSSSYGTTADLRICSDADFTWYQNAVVGFDYVAAITRRCPNWIEAEIQNRSTRPPAFETLLTENGLLMQAEEIADHYREFGRFPSIALLDDVLVHGRGLNMFLRTFLELLAACLNLDDPETLLDDLCKSLTLFMLVTNDAPILLRQEYQWRLQFKSIARENEWRGISCHISESIFRSETANTSYVVSAWQSQASAVPVPGEWELVDENEIPYRDAHQRFYVHALSGTRRAYPTVRSYLRGDSRCYTPYFFCGTLTDAQISSLFSLIQRLLDAAALDQFLPFLRLVNRAAAHEQRWEVYFQLVNLLLGQITLQHFLADAGLPLEQLRLDTEKIARNFGPVTEVQPCLDALCEICWPEDFLEQVCGALEIPGQKPSFSVQVVSAAEIRFTMDLAIYLQAVRHEAYAKSQERAFAAGRGSDQLKLTGESVFDQFLFLIFSSLHASVREHQTMLLILAYLTQMMDRGDICLKARVRFDRNNRRYLFDSSIRNTEMSLSILPRNLGPCFPGFVRAVWLYQGSENFITEVTSYVSNLLSKESPHFRQIVSTARALALVVADYRSMADTLLDWEDILPETPTSI